MNLSKTILLNFCICITVFLCGCNHAKKVEKLVYLSKGDATSIGIVSTFEPKIQPGDRVSILVTALNPASAVPYNQTMVSTQAGTQAPAGGYRVQNDGTIVFPQLGTMQVQGKTLKQLTDHLVTILTKYLRDPVVTIEFLNYRVTVLGEVNKPGTINIQDGKVNLLEAIGLAGDLTVYGKRDNILIIREREGKRELGRVDLSSKNTFNSPFYNLEQNDIVYVQLTKTKVTQSDQSTVRNVGLLASIASVLTSVIILVSTLNN